MEAGIVGLPNVGKSTLFNALTAAGIEAQNYPFCTIEPNVGVVSVPDPRLDTLRKHIETQKMIPAALRLVDIAGLVRGASEGQGLGNKFLSHIREVDAVAYVLPNTMETAVTLLGGAVAGIVNPVNRMRGEPTVTGPYGPLVAAQWFDQRVRFLLRKI